MRACGAGVARGAGEELREPRLLMEEDRRESSEPELERRMRGVRSLLAGGVKEGGWLARELREETAGESEAAEEESSRSPEKRDAW